LSDIKTEVEEVLREGRQRVEDGLVEDQVTVSSELDSMKALYNRVMCYFHLYQKELKMTLVFSL